MDVFKVLVKFKNDDNPQLLQHEGKELSTLSKAELIRIADSMDFKLLDVAKVANIDTSKPTLVKLLNAALCIFKEKEKDSVNQNDEPAPKRRKSTLNSSASDPTTVRHLSFLLNNDVLLVCE